MEASHGLLVDIKVQSINSPPNSHKTILGSLAISSSIGKLLNKCHIYLELAMERGRTEIWRTSAYL